MHDFIATEMARDRRERLLEEARTSRMRKSLRGESRASENKFKAFAKELERDARAFFARVARIETKERKRNV